MEEKYYNYEEYKNLATAIVTQACRDYEDVLRFFKRNAKKIETLWNSHAFMAVVQEKERTKKEIEHFFHDQWFEMLVSGKYDGESFLKQMNDNFTKYGKCLFSDTDLQLMAEGKEPEKFSKGRKIQFHNFTDTKTFN